MYTAVISLSVYHTVQGSFVFENQMYTVSHKKLTLFIFAITFPTVNQFELYLAET